jgi:hypothetical protein
MDCDTCYIYDSQVKLQYCQQITLSPAVLVIFSFSLQFRRYTYCLNNTPIGTVSLFKIYWEAYQLLGIKKIISSPFNYYCALTFLCNPHSTRPISLSYWIVDSINIPQLPTCTSCSPLWWKMHYTELDCGLLHICHCVSLKV